MTKDNLIPKTETIYELKNEIPSYEEFLKTYQGDEAVENSYLSEIDSLEKGYGPCYVCTQNKPVVWKKLYIPCPGVNDDGIPCSNKTYSYWYHATDVGQTEISNRAHIRCTSCYTDRHMSNWVFSCSSHWGDYWSTKASTFRSGLNMAMKVGDFDEFVDDLIAYMSSHRFDSEVSSKWK